MDWTIVDDSQRVRQNVNWRAYFPLLDPCLLASCLSDFWRHTRWASLGRIAGPRDIGRRTTLGCQRLGLKGREGKLLLLNRFGYVSLLVTR